MFAPSGHTPIYNALSWCDRLSKEIWTARNIVRFELDEHGQINEEVDGKREFFTIPLLTCWMLAGMLNTYRVYITSPEGKSIVGSFPLFMHEDNLSALHWLWPGELGSNLTSILEQAVDADEIDFTLKRFRFFDPFTGTINVTDKEKGLRSSRDLVGNEIDAQLRTARNFDGWAVSIRDKDFPKTYEDLMQDLGLNEPRLHDIEENMTEANKNGLSSSCPQQRILTLLNQEPGLTKPEVKSKLFPELSHRRFLHFWARAAEERPEISTPGRKRRSD